jgi:ATP-dependent Lon protease
VGNFDVDVEHQQRVGHLFGPMPPEMRDDTAFMDRIHAFLPGWDVPKINKDLVTNHFGLVSDFLSECWSQLRNQSRVSELQNRVFFGGALSGRDTNAVNKTVSGLLKLLYPSADVPVPDEDLEWAVRIAMEVRRRVKEQQKRVGAAEFRNTHFSYIMGADGVEKFVSTPELQSDNSIGGDPLEPGQVWTISPGGGRKTRASTASRSTKALDLGEGAQQAHSARVPREHRLRRAESVRQVAAVGWRQRPSAA